VTSDEVALQNHPIEVAAALRNDRFWGNPVTATDPVLGNTEIELLRQQLVQAQKMSSLGTLASSVTHEFNNVLTTIINYAKLGLKAESEAERKAALDKVLKAGQRAAAITSSMLGFARKNSTRREMTDIVSLVDEVLTLSDKDLRQHRITVEKHYQGRLVAPVVPGQIEQIFLNLVINARQAMPNGGVLRVDIYQNPQTRYVEVKFADNGCGIPTEKLRHVFEPFYTTKRPDEGGSGGTGLGLAVCRQIIEQHNGRIRVESLPGKGTIFTVKLPSELEG
jgi:signal transduction histidine kinase